MGGATYGKDDPTYVSVADAFSGQHDARFLPGWSAACRGGSGSISLFDDQTYGVGPARGVVYDVVVGINGDGGTSDCDGGTTDGGTAGSATLSWQYQGSFVSGGTGSFRVSPDGTRVIGWGINSGTPRLTFSEVDAEGRDMLDFYFSDSVVGGSYRAIKVPTTTFDLSVLRDTAGLPP
jgi:hypothetical protein